TTVSNAKLKEMLIAEAKKQGKPFGLFFEDISGGFTLTTRDSPQAFQVTPIMVYKVYVDGKPDELVRGVDLIGTPLTSFSKIVAASDKVEVFNGFCGAESGYVPVSAVAPSILTTQIEVQKKAKSSERMPILPAPTGGN
ncbi:MAG TPA: peptidase U62, partial [Terriglobia bacterium]|nr:peptidase U62 [Terriglobia bacterium]